MMPSRRSLFRTLFVLPFLPLVRLLEPKPDFDAVVSEAVEGLEFRRANAILYHDGEGWVVLADETQDENCDIMFDNRRDGFVRWPTDEGGE